MKRKKILAYDEYGNPLTKKDLKGVKLNPDAPTWEEYRGLVTQCHEDLTHSACLLKYKSRLDSLLSRLESDEWIPPSELELLQKELLEIKQIQDRHQKSRPNIPLSDQSKLTH